MPETIETAFLWGLSREAGDADILILTRAPNRPAHMLEGVRGADGSIHWYLRHATGGEIGKFAAKSPETPDDATLVGRDVAKSLAALLGRSVGRGDGVAPQTQSARAPPPTGADTAQTPTILIGTVSGAPGDGNTALAVALAEILRRSPFRPTDKPAEADLQLSATVSLSALEDGAEQLTITWTVTDPSGAQIANLTQANAIPAGLLEGRWGELAYDIALGAAEGLTQVISSAESR